MSHNRKGSRRHDAGRTFAGFSPHNGLKYRPVIVEIVQALRIFLGISPSMHDSVPPVLAGVRRYLVIVRRNLPPKIKRSCVTRLFVRVKVYLHFKRFPSFLASIRKYERKPLLSQAIATMLDTATNLIFHSRAAAFSSFPSCKGAEIMPAETSQSDGSLAPDCYAGERPRVTFRRMPCCTGASRRHACFHNCTSKHQVLVLNICPLPGVSSSAFAQAFSLTLTPCHHLALK